MALYVQVRPEDLVRLTKITGKVYKSARVIVSPTQEAIEENKVEGEELIVVSREQADCFGSYPLIILAKPIGRDESAR